MQKVLYRLSPELLDAFDEYIRFGEDELAFNVPDLLRYINTGYKDDQKELDNSVKLLKSCVFGLKVESDQIQKVKTLLPKIGNTDVVSKTVFAGVEIVGKVDFMGFGKAVMFSGVKRYQLPAMLHSNNQWLMKGLSDQGLKSMNYIIQSESEIFFETYTPDTYDFERLENTVHLFKMFLDEYSHLITNTKVKLHGQGSVTEMEPTHF